MPEQKTSRVDFICIFALSVEWLLFGSFHFILRQYTEDEIPEFLPYKTFIATVTGMIEVAAGILILLPKTRKWAAMTSLVLLLLFLPSIYKMLTDDTAMPFTGFWLNFARVILVPNHVFLILCALHLWKEKSTIDPL